MADRMDDQRLIDAMARTIERDAKRIAALNAELAEAKDYAQTLRRSLDMCVDAITREQSPSVLTAAIVEEAKQVLAGKVR